MELFFTLVNIGLQRNILMNLGFMGTFLQYRNEDILLSGNFLNVISCLP